MNKCPKTLSSKHFWVKENYYAYRQEYYGSGGVGYGGTVSPDFVYEKCLGCGIIKDRKEREK